MKHTGRDRNMGCKIAILIMFTVKNQIVDISERAEPKKLNTTYKMSTIGAISITQLDKACRVPHIDILRNFRLSQL